MHVLCRRATGGLLFISIVGLVFPGGDLKGLQLKMEDQQMIIEDFLLAMGDP